MVEIDVNRGHYFPQETTNEGPTLINAWACHNLYVNRAMRHTPPSQTKANPNLIMVPLIPVTYTSAQLHERNKMKLSNFALFQLEVSL